MFPSQPDAPPRPRLPRWVWGLVALCLVLLGVVGGLAASAVARGDQSPAAAPTTTSAPSTTTTLPSELSPDELAARFGDAVYKVEAQGCYGAVSGSAFAIDGHHLVTNHHVVAADASPTLVSRSGRHLRAEVVGSSSTPDVAVLRVRDPLLDTLRFARTSALTEGQRIVALGYPLPEGDFAVAPGAITSFEVRNGRRTAARTDAAVDHGNSGGPALTTAGEVVGVVTAFDGRATQKLGLAYTEDALRAQIEAGLEGRASVEVDSCAGDGSLPAPEPAEASAPCPTGAPRVVVDAVEAVADGPSAAGDTAFYNVTVRGRVVSEATAGVSVFAVQGVLEGAFDGEFYAIVPATDLAPGGASPWEVSTFVESPSPPDTAGATPDGSWWWSDVAHYDCPGPA